MDASRAKVSLRRKRHRRVRKKVIGTEVRPRLAVFKSAKHIYAQIIDDSQGRTIAAASTLKLKNIKPKDKESKNIAAAREVGIHIAEAAKKNGIEKVTFDRGGFVYHGRIAALAEAARSGGLEF